MSSPLKSSVRKDLRVQVERAACYVNSMNAKQAYPAEIGDMSLGGMSFFTNEAPFNEKSLVEIRIPGLKGHHVIFLGMVMSVPEPQTEKPNFNYRYSVRFDRKLTEKEFRTMLSSLALVAYEI